jgi:hypothetical protein
MASDELWIKNKPKFKIQQILSKINGTINDNPEKGIIEVLYIS